MIKSRAPAFRNRCRMRTSPHAAQKCPGVEERHGFAGVLRALGGMGGHIGAPHQTGPDARRRPPAVGRPHLRQPRRWAFFFSSLLGVSSSRQRFAPGGSAMLSNSQTEARKLHAGLKHPVIDADGHWAEYAPLMREEFRRIGGDTAVEALAMASARIPKSLAMSVAERRRRRIGQEAFWFLPTK